MSTPTEAMRPAEFSRELLAALDASEGRRRRRKRDTTPDAIGLSMKRELLELVAQEDPAAAEFEAWLFEYCQAHAGVHAVALSILDEWRFAGDLDGLRDWLAHGAPSDDR
jgi:hypothetical protein